MLTAAAIDVRQPGTPSPKASQADGFGIPAPPLHGQQAWVPAGRVVHVAGLAIPGMVYLGLPPLTKGRHFEPSLIDPCLPVAAQGPSISKRSMCVMYSAMSPHERRGYLTWLAEGRQDRCADIRYVFIFFYGLERRALIDCKLDPAAAEDAPLIVAELRRLIGLYGRKDMSFVTAATGLIFWIENEGCPQQLYWARSPDFLKVYGLRTYTHVAVAQSIADGVPFSAKLALAWLLADGNTYLRDAVKSHRPQFDRLFDDLYAKEFGAGLLPARTDTRLKLFYRPASPGLVENPLLARAIGDVPDPSTLKDALESIRSVVDEATSEIERYARIVAPRLGACVTLDVLSQVPMQLWDPEPRQTVQSLVARVRAGMVTISLTGLVELIDDSAVANKYSALCVSRVLDEAGIATEHELTGGRRLKPDQLLVLFVAPKEQEPGAFDTHYRAATLFLALATVVASADGQIADATQQYVHERLAAWPHEPLRTCVRLRAHLQLLAAAPPTLPAVKKQLGEFGAPSAEALVAFAVDVARAGKEPSPAAVKLLNKVYRALGLDPKRVANDIHAAAAGGPGATSAGFRLDAERIATLQSDTAKVSVLLADIFRDDEPTQQAAPTPDAPAQAQEGPQDRLLGLDPAHTALARLILSKPAWSRAELLDGAMERINDAAFDAHDIPFTSRACGTTHEPARSSARGCLAC